MRRGGATCPDRELDGAHRVLRRYALHARDLLVALGASETRQDQRLLPVDEVAAVQLRAHLHREGALSQPFGSEDRIGDGAGEIAAHADEHAHVPAVHRREGVHGVETSSAWRVDAAYFVEAREEGLARVVVDAARAIALHIAVPAHGRRAGPRPADVSAEHQEIHDLTDGVDPVLVLADAEAPADDGARGADVDVGRSADLLLAEPGLGDEIAPRRGLDERTVLVDTVRVGVEELPVDHGRVRCGGLEDGLRHPADERKITAGSHLQGAGRGVRRLEPRHIEDLVRHDRARRARFDERIDVDHLRAAVDRFGETRQHAGSVGCRVHPEHEEGIALFPVLERRRALARRERGIESTPGGLVAHVRAVRQIVGAELARPQLVEERGLVAESAGRVERCLVGAVERPQLRADEGVGVLPGDRHVAVGVGVVDHRLGEPALVFEVEVRPRRELGDRVRGEEGAVDALARHLPRDVLDAVLADVEGDALVVGPGTSGAVESADRVVHREHGAGADDRFPCAQEHLPHREGRAPTGGGVVVGRTRPGAVRRGAEAALTRLVGHEAQRGAARVRGILPGHRKFLPEGAVVTADAAAMRASRSSCVERRRSARA